MRGLTRERLSARDAGPHVASSACCCPLNPFGRRSADRLTRLLPAGSGLSRQDQTNLGHGAPLRSDDTDASSEIDAGLSKLERLPCCRTLFASERLSPSTRERVPAIFSVAGGFRVASSISEMKQAWGLGSRMG